MGEGPVNTIGALSGSLAPIKWTLREWGVMRGARDINYIHNWNGDKSPMVHQWDRTSELTHSNLAVFHGLGS
jgi:hypothetical protein